MICSPGWRCPEAPAGERASRLMRCLGHQARWKRTGLLRVAVIARVQFPTIDSSSFRRKHLQKEGRVYSGSTTCQIRRHHIVVKEIIGVCTRLLSQCRKHERLTCVSTIFLRQVHYILIQFFYLVICSLLQL